MPNPKTVKIAHASGYAVINECDFVEGTHELYDENAKPKRRKPKKSAPKSEPKSEPTIEDSIEGDAAGPPSE